MAERLNAAVLPATAGPPVAEKPFYRRIGNQQIMPCVYILRSEATKRFYVGSSRENSASVRLKAHNGGKVRSTKSGRPWILVHEESLPDYTQARQRENYLKTGVGRDWIKINLEGWQSG